MPSAETAFIDLLRAASTFPAARGLLDDAAVLDIGGTQLVLTKDMLVEGVHYLPDDPPEDVAWKLLAVNLSDLAAKGARPLGVLLGFTLGAADWDRRFARGLNTACEELGAPLLGGDTVAGDPRHARTLSLTAIGVCGEVVPSRSGAKAGDRLWITGTVGDAMLGCRALQRGEWAPDALVRAYRRPQPRLAEGRALAPLVTAMMDVSDGLLLDAGRMALASGCGVSIERAAVPHSADFLHAADPAAIDDALRWGDDYQLLFTLPPDAQPPVAATAVGRFIAADPGTLLLDGAPVIAPLGYQHGGAAD